MSKKFAIVVFGLLLYASQGWAGTLGNGWAQRNAAAGLAPEEAKTKYVFCYAGNPRVVYLTQVIALAPTTSAPNLGVAYANYIQKTYGVPAIDRQRCVTADSIADATAEKQRYKGMLGTKSLIEIEWAGAGADRGTSP